MMDMHTRDQYLYTLIFKNGYFLKSKKEKSKLLDEYCKNTEHNRKYVIWKIRHGKYFPKQSQKRKRKRKAHYDVQVKAALVKCWEIFDNPCGQRLASLLRTEVERLRKLEELMCSDEVAEKLLMISSRTIDQKLKDHKQKQFLRRKYHRKNHPLLYQKIPVKLSDEWDRDELGNIQIDLVEHCGQSTRGEYINTLSTTDITSGWWEAEAVMGRSQEAVFNGLKELRNRFPFLFKEIHSDNGTEFINWHLFRYTQKEELGFSRSRPNKKNDNCFVEQKNWTHVKKFVGYLRYDRQEELSILNDLYRNELRLYKNFFQSVMKLIVKERRGGKIHRKYDESRTPYHRIIESKEVSEKIKEGLKKIYESLNPAQLKRGIDAKLDMLYKVYQRKNKFQKVDSQKKLKPHSVR
jgi:hypothetical protein